MEPKDNIRLAINGRTDIGQVRGENEDHIGWYNHPSLPFGFVIIADGMGGYTGGARASALAVDVIDRYLKAIPDQGFQSCTPDQQLLMVHAILMEAFSAANQAILDAKIDSPQHANMGSTVVVGVLWEQHVTIAHLGDSRAYLWNRDGLVQLTRDHSLVQEMIDAGTMTESQARTSGVRNHITRALGVTEFVEPSMNSYRLEQNTLLMFCTDGLTEYLDNLELEHVLSTHRPALECCYRFISDANQQGGKDNISVGIMEFTLRDQTRAETSLPKAPAGTGEDVTLRPGAGI